jgi:tetratricopeptide (TPR) repeat protein
MLQSFTEGYRRLGQTDEALRRAIEARDLLKGLAERDPDEEQWSFSLSYAHHQVGSLRYTERALAPALDSFQAGLAIAERFVKADVEDDEWRHRMLQLRLAIGDVHLIQGRLSDASRHYRSAIAGVEEFAKAVKQTMAQAVQSHTHLLAVILHAANRLGGVTQLQGSYKEALSYFRLLRDVRAHIAAKHPESVSLRSEVADSDYRIGRVYLHLGDFGAAEQSRRRGLAALEPIAVADRKNVAAQRDVVVMNDSIGQVMLAQGRTAEALAMARANLAAAKQFSADDPNNAEWRGYVAVGHDRVADALRATGDLTAALQEYEQVQMITAKLLASNQSDADLIKLLADARFKAGEILQATGRQEEAVKNFRDSMALSETLVQGNPDIVYFRNRLLQARWRLATTGSGSAVDATAALDALRELGRQHKLTFEQQRWLATAGSGPAISPTR